jgi:hypothetical protein
MQVRSKGCVSFWRPPRVGDIPWDTPTRKSSRALTKVSGRCSGGKRPDFARPAGRRVSSSSAEALCPCSQPRQRAELTATLPPASQHLLEPLSAARPCEHLHVPSALGGRTRAHEVELARVLNPGRSVQRTILILPPAQPDVLLAGGDASRVGVVEGHQRGVAPAPLTLSCISASHPTPPVFEEEGSATASCVGLNRVLPSGKDLPWTVRSHESLTGLTPRGWQARGLRVVVSPAPVEPVTPVSLSR